MIPRRFFWLFDLLILGGAFAAAYLLVPYFGHFFQVGTRLTLVSQLLDVPSNWKGEMPAVSESLWILLVMALTALVVIGLSGSHGSLLKASLTMIIVLNVVAVLI